MRRFDWSSEKNLVLQSQRNVSFEDVVTAIDYGYLLDIETGRLDYPHQFVYIVAIDGYVYMVPYVVEGDTHFLKTIIPSRIHTRKYLDAIGELNDE